MRTKQWAIEDVLEELYEENRPSPEIYQRIKGGLSKLNYHELEDLRVAVILIKTRKGDTL